MKTLLLALLALSSVAFAKDNWFYGSAHALGGYPMVGIGIRSTHGSHGLDLSGNVCPLNKLSPVIFHAKGQYLFYPVKDFLYLGGGLGVLNEPESMKRISGSFEGTLGCQWGLSRKNTFFLQANLTVPFDKPELPDRSEFTARMLPGLTAGIGF